MKDPNGENQEINTSVDNLNLDARPSVLRLIKPWQLVTLVLLVIIAFSAFQVYDATKSKARAPGCTIEMYERTGECWS